MSRIRQIAVVTLARSEYSACLPLMRAIQADAELGLSLVVGGMHLSPEYGRTVDQIEADGFAIAERVEMLLSSDKPEGVAKSIGVGLIGFAQYFARQRPDIVMLVGDRSELLAVACAALPFQLPLAHVSGGDITEGAIDNQVRHALTKLAHLHFVSLPQHAQRLRQMGEEGWRVFVTGEPALDGLGQIRLLSRDELSHALGVALEPPVMIITFHPTTLGVDSMAGPTDALLAALAGWPGTKIFTYPNADVDSHVIVGRFEGFVRDQPLARLFANLGQLNYCSLLAQADVMVGNSSSGIWEAPSFGLPVVNVGDRQLGRLRAGNVIDTVATVDRIGQAIQKALTPAFRVAVRNLSNPYGDGHAAARIIKILKDIPLGEDLIRKRFVDQAHPSRQEAR